jgi:tripartite-type tricarboxylate transporter receptor subunit TctC
MTHRFSRRAAFAFSACAAAPAHAQAWPTRQITLIAPFTPGGPVDVLARALAQGHQAMSGPAAVVENRTGANGNLGIEAARRAAPDGHTLLVVPAGNMTINPTLMADLP